MIEVHDFSIFYKNNIPIGMVLLMILMKKTYQNSLTKLNQIFTKGGNVGRGKNMEVQTWS